MLHKEEIIVNHPIENVYRVVADVEDYENFIPWISSSKIINKYDNVVEYEIKIVFKGLKETFSTKDIFYPNTKIEIFLLKGPFKNLHTLWEFEEISSEKTKIKFQINFEFNSKVLNALFSGVFLVAQKKIISLFIKKLNQQKS